MKKVFWFVILVAVAASFYASSHPDGLEKVAENLGFIDRAAERSAPLPDYTTPGLPEGGISTSVSGIAGVLIILAIFWLAAYVMKKEDKVMNKQLLLVLALLLLAVAPVWAARPLVTDDFGTVDLGKYELEVGAGSTTFAGSTTNGLGVSFKRGFTTCFDLGIEVPYSLTAPTGIGDATIHAKYKAVELGEEEGVTAKLSVKLTNGDSVSGLGSGFTDYTLIAIYSKPLAGLKTHYNLGYTLVGVAAGSPEANTINYGAAVEKELPAGVEVVGEIYGTSAAVGSENAVQLGVRWQVNELVRLDAGYSLPLNEGGVNVVTAGLTAEF